MDKLDNDLNFHTRSAQLEMDEKQEIAAQLSRNVNGASEDPTRSTLHTGQQFTGGLGPTGDSEGAPEEIPPQSAVGQPLYSLQDADSPAQSFDIGNTPARTAAPDGKVTRGERVTQTESESFKAPESTAQTSLNVGHAPVGDPVSQAELSGVEDQGFATVVSSEAHDVNNAPQDISLNNTSVLENAQGSVIGSISVVDPDAGDTHNFDVSDDRFEIVDGQLRLKPGITLNYEDAAQIDVEITVTDAEGATLTERFTVEVQDVNEAPTALTLDGLSVPENTEGAVIGTVSVVDPDAGDTHNFEVSDDRFEIVDGQLRLKPGVALNHEDSAHIEVDVTVTDAEGATFTERFTVEVEDVNEAPTALTLDNLSVPENVEGAVIGTISVADPDAGDMHDFDVSDDRFEIVDGQLKLKPGVTLNHEDTAQIGVEVTVTDSEGATLTEQFTVEVKDVNEGPSDLSLETNSENLVQNGSFEEFEVDSGRWKGFDSDQTGSWNDSHGMEIWDNLGGREASDGDQLLEMDHGRGVDSISQTIQTDSGQLYDLSVDLRERLAGGTDTVEVYWNGNLVAELDPQSDDWETFQQRVVGTGQDTLELREAESENDTYGALVDNITLTAAELTVAENVDGAIVGQLSFEDPDQNDTHTFEVSDDRFEVVGNQLRVKPGVALDYEEASSIDVDVTVVDAGGLSQTESFTVNVADVAEMTLATGFHVKYFDVDQRLSKLDDIDWTADPDHAEVMSEINFANDHGSFWEEGSKDTFGVQVNGNIEVEDGGTFTFFLGADDGAVLVINGNPVVANDGVHGFRTRTGEIELEPGTHSIEIRYFENSGRAGLTLEWEGPGLDGRELVTAPDISEAQTVAGTSLAIEVDVGGVGVTDETSFEVSNLPAGTLVDAGGVTFTASADGVAELDGWQGDMLTITPPPEFSGTVDASLRHSTPTGNNSSHEGVQTLTFEVSEASLTPPDAKMVGGFHASYFDTHTRLKNLEDIDWNAEPTHQEFVQEINYENSTDSFWDGGSKDTFGAKLEGKFTVEEGGSYTFFAGGDDGVAVIINGKMVVDNDGLHGFRTRSGEIDLEPGTYDIEVRYFENYGHAGLKLEWDGPDTAGRELLQANPQPMVGQDGTLEVAINLDHASDQAAVSLEGLPANTLLTSGEDSVLTDGGPTDLSGWSLDYLEVSPPPGFEGTIEGEIIVSDVGFNGAQLTSESAFVLEIGPTGESAKDLTPDLAETFEMAKQTETPTRWHMEHSEDGGEQDSDVMAEAVLTNPSTEISSIETDAYERIDW